MNILFLSNTRFATTPYRDASTRYRCYNMAEALLNEQHRADITVIDDVDVNIISRYDTVVVLRPIYSRKFEKIVEECRDHGVTLIADFDDLLFDPELASQSPIVVNQQATEQQIRGVFNRHLKALGSFDQVIVASEALIPHVNKNAPDAICAHIPSGLSEYWLEYNKHVQKRTFSPGAISYLPGTRSHDRDFKLVEGALADAVNNSDELFLQVIGALDIDDTLFDDGKIARGQWVDYFALPRIIAESWLTIAPLEATEFNACKSHIKLLESAAFGTPIINANCPDFTPHNVDGNFTVNEADEWLDIIDQLHDPDFYMHCSEQLSNYVRANCMTRNQLSKFIEFANANTQNHDNEYTVSLSKAG